MELSEVVNAHFAFPVVGVVVCALLVFAFGFKSPVQPPSFDSWNDDDDDKKSTKKSKQKRHKPDGHIITIDNQTSSPSTSKASTTKQQSPSSRVLPSVGEKAEQQQVKVKSKKQKSVEDEISVAEEKPVREAEATGDWTKALSKKERKNRGKKEETGKDWKKDDSKKDEHKADKNEVQDVTVNVVKISPRSSSVRDNTSPGSVTRKVAPKLNIINEITVTAPAPVDRPLANSTVDRPLVKAPADRPVLNDAAQIHPIVEVSKVKVNVSEQVKPQVTVVDVKKPKEKPVKESANVPKVVHPNAALPSKVAVAEEATVSSDLAAASAESVMPIVTPAIQTAPSEKTSPAENTSPAKTTSPSEKTSPAKSPKKKKSPESRAKYQEVPVAVSQDIVTRDPTIQFRDLGAPPVSSDPKVVHRDDEIKNLHSGNAKEEDSGFAAPDLQDDKTSPTTSTVVFDELGDWQEAKPIKKKRKAQREF